MKRDVTYRPLLELLVEHSLKDTPYDRQSLSVVSSTNTNTSCTLRYQGKIVKKNTQYGTRSIDGVFLQVLPDQRHQYSLNCCRDCDNYMGAMVTSIPFVHPTHVAKIIQLLRQQALYNTIIGSCLRKRASAGERLIQ